MTSCATISFRTLLVILLLSTLTKCIDRITFPFKDDTKLLIIYGQLNDVDEPHYIYVSETFAGGSPKVVNGVLIRTELPSPVKGAIVRLHDEAGNAYNFIETKEPGKYELTTLAAGKPGEHYSLEVIAGENAYRSAPEKMPERIGVDSAFYEITEDVVVSKDETRLAHLLKIHSKTKLPVSQEDYFLRWDLDEVYFWELTFFPNPFNVPPPDCFVYSKPDPQRINLLDGSLVSSTSVVQQLGTREIDASFKNRHYIIVRQQSMTEANFRYWKNVKQLIGNTGSVFDIPPAILTGNMIDVNDPTKKALGYFEVCRLSEVKFFLVKGFIPYYIEDFCEYDPAKPLNKYPKSCITCSNIPNSTGVRPPWF